MKSAVLLASALSAVVLADSTSNPYVAPGPSDLRSPCPMLNSLANHAYLPHDGVNVSMADLISAFDLALNMGADAAELVGTVALTTSTTGNASTFNLNDVDVHNVIEHDGSLSRADIYFGDNHSFNESVWAGTKAYFTEDVITIATAAQARAGRLALDATQNPDFNFTTTAHTNSLIESSLYLSTFGDPYEGNATTSFVTIFFEEERLPFDEGWTAPAQRTNVTTLLAMAAKVAAASA